MLLIPIRVRRDPMAGFTPYGDDALDAAKSRTREEIESSEREIRDEAAFREGRFAYDMRMTRRFVLVGLFISAIAILSFHVKVIMAILTVTWFTVSGRQMIVTRRKERFDEQHAYRLEVHRLALAIRDEIDAAAIAAHSIEPDVLEPDDPPEPAGPPAENAP